MATRMQQRRGTAAQWTSANPILAAGEIGFETDTGKFKIGNGSSAWASLTYFADVSVLVDGAPELLDTLNELAAALGDDPAFITTVSTSLETHRQDTTDVHGIPDTSVLVVQNDLNSAVSTHNSDTTEVHGIADTSVLATLTTVSDSISTHNSDTTGVHGIADTSVLATTTDVSDAQAAAETFATGAVSTHSSDTTNVHGIADTASLATTTDVSDAQTAAETFATGAVSDHNAETLNVHGIADTASLATTTDVSDAQTAAETFATGAVSDHNAETLNVHGIADTSVLATQTYANDAVSNHSSDTTNVHGILDTGNLVLTDDSRLSDTRTPTDNTVSTDKIVNLAVTDAKLAADAVTTAKILDGAVTSAKIADGTIVNADINASAAIAQSKIADLTTDLAAKAPLESPTFTGTVSGITKTMVGLGNVDNTSDANKPVSTATQTALDAKASLSGATFTGSVEIDQNLTVDGNLTVNGTTFNASSTSIVIEDNMVQLAHQNAANTVDLGIVVAYNDGAAKHAGIVRDVSDAKWKLFKDVSTEPSTTVAFGEGSLDALAVGALEATTVTPSSGVVFSDGTQTKEGVASRTPIIQKTDSYTLSALSERDSLIEVNKASAATITIPANSSVAYPVGTSIDILQTGAGQVTIAGAGGVTVNGTPGLKLRTQWSSATLFKRATDTWVVMGDLSA